MLPQVGRPGTIEQIVTSLQAVLKLLAPYANPQPWQPVVFQNSFANYATTHLPCAYRKGADGVVRLRGLAARAAVALNTPIFTLPAGYRPNKEMNVVITAAGRSAAVAVAVTGAVTVFAADAAAWNTDISFACISFDTDM